MCAYVHRNGNAKKEICELMKRSTGSFDFHHIVERQHLADISVNGMLDFMYQYEIPTVMLHNVKHQLAYNAILHIKETRHRYLGKESNSIGIEERQKRAIRLSHNPEGRKLLQKQIDEMMDIYGEVYHNEPVIRKIASNILNHYSDLIR